jgi:hypothetical protein
VHVTHVIELPHRGIDYGEASTALTPSLEVLFIVRPGNIGAFWFEWFVHAVMVSPATSLGGMQVIMYVPYIWPVDKDMFVKVAPGNLTYPNSNTLIATI